METAFFVHVPWVVFVLFSARALERISHKRKLKHARRTLKAPFCVVAGSNAPAEEAVSEGDRVFI